jgi:hypothetical protein
VRPPDEEIPADEDLYVLLQGEDVQQGMVVAEAITLKGTSAARSSYTRIDGLAGTRATAGHNGVAAVTPAELPVDFQIAPSPKRWEWIAVDKPEVMDGREYVDHAELRARDLADRPSKAASKAPKSSVTKRDIKNKLCEKLRILIQPTPPAAK